MSDNDRLFFAFLYLIGFLIWCLVAIVIIHLGVRSGTREIRETVARVDRTQRQILTAIQSANEQLAWLCQYFSQR